MLLKNVASQLVQLGSLIKTTDGSRLTSSATVRWCKDGTWADGAGTLSVEETDQYKYAPTQGETNCTQWAIAVDHANAVQPLVLCGRTMLANVGDVYSIGGTTQTAGDLAALINAVDDYVDTEVAAIKAKTDNLPASPANEATLSTIASYIDTEVAAIKAKTDNLPASPANEATLTTIASYIDTEVAAIKAKTDNLPSDPADASDIAAAFAALTTDVTDLETAVTNLANSTVQLDATGELAFQAFYAANTASTSIDDVIDAIGTGGGGGDPWTTSLPGTYTAGQAGYILGHNLDAQISGIGGATGPGADTVTITIKVASVAVANAQVWISSDSGGSNVIAGTKLTNSQGEVVFLLDAGTTYYLWMQKDGVEPILGQSFVAVADT